MNSNDAKTRYNRVILKVDIFSKSSKKQPFSNLFQLIWNLSIDKKVVLMAECGLVGAPNCFHLSYLLGPKGAHSLRERRARERGRGREDRSTDLIS